MQIVREGKPNISGLTERSILRKALRGGFESHLPLQVFNSFHFIPRLSGPVVKVNWSRGRNSSGLARQRFRLDVIWFG